MTPERQIDQIADEFEAAWQAGKFPDLQAFADRIAQQHRDALLAALIPLDMTYHRKENVYQSPGDYSSLGDLAVEIAGREIGDDSGLDETIQTDGDGSSPSPVANLANTLDSGPGTTSPPPLGPVKYFGEYELLSEIARGGMGVVYKARQVKLNRIVALKMILSGNLAGSEEVKRFQTEAEAAANLDHPGIVPIYEIGEHNGQHYFSMGFVEGQSLQQKLAAGPLPAKEAARLTRKIAEAVAYAHEKGVIHRDLKPANVLLDTNGEPKVTDFGLAKKVDADSGLTRTGSIMGTPSYMPPEQATGQTDKIGPAADVYSLGAILYALLTGRPPFQAANVVDTLKQVIEQEPVTPRTLDNKIPIELETISLKCLEKNIASRYASTQELVDELKRFDRGEPIHARRIGPTARSLRWCKRNPAVTGFLSMISILFIVIAVSLWSEFRQRRIAQSNADRARLAEVKAKEQESLATQRLVDLSAQAKQASHVLTAYAADEYQQNYFNSAASKMFTAWKLRDGHDPLKPACSRVLTDILTRGGRSWIALKTNGATNIAFDIEQSAIRTAIANQPWQTWDSRTGELRSGLQVDADVEVARSLDGAYEITFKRDRSNKSICLIDSKSKNVICESLPLEKGDFYRADLSSDGTKLITFCSVVTGHMDGEEEKGDHVQIWDAKTGKSLGGPIEDLDGWKLSPDGNRMAVVKYSAIDLVDTNTAKCLDTFSHTNRSDYGRGIAFSPDSKILAISDEENLTLRDASTGKAFGNSMRHKNGPINSIAFSGDSKRLASASDDKSAKLWNAYTGDPIGEPMIHEDSVLQVLFSSDNSRIATRTHTNVKLWDSFSGKAIGKPIAHEGYDGGVVFSPDGLNVATYSNQTVRLVNSRDAESIGEPIHFEKEVVSMLFSPDGTQLLTVTRDNEVRVWNIESMLPPRRLLSVKEHVEELIVSPDGGRLAVVFETGVSTVSWHYMRMFDLKKERWVGGVIPTQPPVVLSADGTQISGIGPTGSVRTYDVSTGSHSDDLFLFSAEAVAIDYHSTGNEFAIVLGDGRVCIANPQTGEIRWIGHGISNSVKSLAIDPSSDKFCLLGRDHSITFLDGLTKPPSDFLVAEGDSIDGWGLSPNGKLLVTSTTYGDLRMWDAVSGESISYTSKKEANAKMLAFSPDGNVLATSSGNVVTLRDGETGIPIGRTIDPKDRIKYLTSASNRTETENRVNSFVFCDDGRKLLTSGDNFVDIWDVDTIVPEDMTSFFAHLAGPREKQNPYEQKTRKQLTDLQRQREMRCRCRLTSIAFEQQNWFAFEFHIHYVLQEFPNEVKWRMLFANALASQGNWSEASKAAAEALKIEHSIESIKLNILCSGDKLSRDRLITEINECVSLIDSRTELDLLHSILESVLVLDDSSLPWDSVNETVASSIDYVSDQERLMVTHGPYEPYEKNRMLSKRYALLGASFFRMGRIDEAKDALLKAIELLKKPFTETQFDDYFARLTSNAGDLPDNLFFSHAFLVLVNWRQGDTESAAKLTSFMNRIQELQVPNDWIQREMRNRLEREIANATKNR